MKRIQIDGIPAWVTAGLLRLGGSHPCKSHLMLVLCLVPHTLHKSIAGPGASECWLRDRLISKMRPSWAQLPTKSSKQWVKLATSNRWPWPQKGLGHSYSFWDEC